jgi:biopolymer transport protein ExbD
MARPEINVTPLIDILLVLLIIFMIVTPVKPSRFEARVPAEPQTQPVDTHPHTLVVALEPDGSITLNTHRVAAAGVYSGLVESLEVIFEERQHNGVRSTSDPSRTETTVFIKAPYAASYGSVAALVDAVKLAGADPVSLAIDGGK